MFSECGTVKQVYLQPKPSSGPPLEENKDEGDLFSRPTPLSKVSVSLTGAMEINSCFILMNLFEVAAASLSIAEQKRWL
jgi:hypothetical protein